MNVKPLADRVLVEALEAAEKTAGGLYVPDTAKEKPQKGRIVVVGLMAGIRAEIDLSLLLRKRARMMGTQLRSRPLEEKIFATQEFARHLVPLFARGALKPVVDRVFPLEKAADAHSYVASNEGFGKVVLAV